MIDINTTLVLGAGSSMPYGYPSGAELVKQIVFRLSQKEGVDPNYYRQLTFMGFPAALIDSFVCDLMGANVRSIDEFLECRPDYREIGKIAIAQAIVGCERALSREDILSKFNRKNTIYDKPELWYAGLLGVMGTDIEQFASNKISIITFNYDRSLENFLHGALVSKYGRKQETKIIDGIKKLKINHVHGKLGDLPWEGTLSSRPYGVVKDDDELRASGNLISIVYEGQLRSKQFEEAHKVLCESSRVVFLGFGYHDVNLRRLGIDRIPPNGTKLLGTRNGVEDLQVRNLVRKFGALKLLTQIHESHRIHDFLRKIINLDGPELAVS